MCAKIYRSTLGDVGKITSVPAPESCPGWWLFLGWGNGKITGQVAPGNHPELSRCSYNGKNIIWEVCLDVGMGCLQPPVGFEEKLWSLEREKAEGEKVFW